MSISVVYIVILPFSRIYIRYSNSLFFWKNSIEYFMWYNIKLCLHKHSLDSIAPQINCQEVIYLFSRKTFLFTRSWNQFNLITWLIVLTVKELRENLMGICNNYQILCLGNIFQIIRNCQFYLNIEQVYKNTFVVILNGSYFSTYPSFVLKLLWYSRYFFLHFFHFHLL